MRGNLNIALNIALILTTFAWAWFSGELDEMNLKHLPTDEE